MTFVNTVKALFIINKVLEADRQTTWLDAYDATYALKAMTNMFVTRYDWFRQSFWNAIKVSIFVSKVNGLLLTWSFWLNVIHEINQSNIRKKLFWYFTIFLRKKSVSYEKWTPTNFLTGPQCQKLNIATISFHAE